MPNLRPVPSDTELKQHFSNLIVEDNGILNEVVSELLDTFRETRKEGQPREFAYGKLLAYLRDQNEPTLIHLCAAAIWECAEEISGTETNGT